VGKELFARAVHDSGPRRSKPFVAINCAAVPENLIEAELFGYAPGAFTGARRDGSPGRVREAQGGTLFLDEIGDMPLPMQARLLRVLQERQVSPLGGGPSVTVDFALMCATHCKLREAAEQGRFRSDLYYRINGLTLQLPPLRERTDFAVLTKRLLHDLNPGRLVGMAPKLLERLRQHPWPGNLRQYANVLRTASAMLVFNCINRHI
jgi:transcriptional regulator with PAS, ATPase and Fis domain